MQHPFPVVVRIEKPARLIGEDEGFARWVGALLLPALKIVRETPGDVHHRQTLLGLSPRANFALIDGLNDLQGGGFMMLLRRPTHLRSLRQAESAEVLAAGKNGSSRNRIVCVDFVECRDLGLQTMSIGHRTTSFAPLRKLPALDMPTLHR